MSEESWKEKREYQREERSMLSEDYIHAAYEELTALDSKDGRKVTLVKHRGSGRIAVKKVIPAENLGIFEKLRELHHPNLVQILEIYPQGEQAVIIEEFISGETLEAKLEQEGVLPKEQAVEYTSQILEALKIVHQHHIIHRDITPGNVLISLDGVVKLTDFDIARTRKEKKSRDTTILGTVGYAPPEQYGFYQTDVTADFYSVGVLLNVMLTGRIPGEGITEHKHLGKIIRKCTQIDPAKRYSSAESIQRELQQEYADKREKKKIEKDKSVIPGFRNGIRWRKYVAIAGYVMMFFMTALSVEEVAEDPYAVFLETIAVFLYIWLVFLIASNFGRWDRRLFPFSKMPKEICIAIRIIACVVVFCYGATLENYVRRTLLHLPVK